MPKDDITSWSVDYLAHHIQDHLLGAGQTLECEPGEFAWHINVYEDLPLKEGDEVPRRESIWQDQDITERGALFKAYHRFWSPPTRDDDPWVLKPHRPALAAVAQNLSEKYADPEDLNPEEVASVYAQMKPDTKRK